MIVSATGWDCAHRGSLCILFIYPANELEHHADGEGQQDRHRGGGEKQSDGGKGSRLLQNLLCVMHVSEGRYVIDCLVSSPPQKKTIYGNNDCFGAVFADLKQV